MGFTELVCEGLVQEEESPSPFQLLQHVEDPDYTSQNEKSHYLAIGFLALNP